jgi:hypothetical protein
MPRKKELKDLKKYNLPLLELIHKAQEINNLRFCVRILFVTLNRQIGEDKDMFEI